MAGQEGFRIRGDFDLAVMNSYTLSGMASAGFLSAMLSPELTFADIREMPKCMDAELAIYGRLPVMVTQTCLFEGKRRTVHLHHARPDGRHARRRMAGDEAFRLPQHRLGGAQALARRRDAGVDRSRSLGGAAVCFSTESARECLEVAESYIQGTHYKPNGITRGLYYRGVL